MKAKELKILRKKLTKANRSEYNPLESFSKESLKLVVGQLSKKEGSDKENQNDVPETVLSTTFCRSGDLSENQLQECLALFERNMGDMYRKSSWGLNMEEKKEEFQHDKARFLLLQSDDENLAGFVHFRFDYDDEEHPSAAVLYVFEIQIDQMYRRQGLGKKMMDIAETIALEAEMPKVMLTVFKSNKGAMDFYKQLEYSIDETSPSKYNEPADYEILSRSISSK